MFNLFVDKIKIFKFFNKIDIQSKSIRSPEMSSKTPKEIVDKRFFLKKRRFSEIEIEEKDKNSELNETFLNSSDDWRSRVIFILVFKIKS